MSFPENHLPNAGIKEPIDANGVLLAVGDTVVDQGFHVGTVGAILTTGFVGVRFPTPAGDHVAMYHAQFLAKREAA